MIWSTHDCNGPKSSRHIAEGTANTGWEPEPCEEWAKAPPLAIAAMRQTNTVQSMLGQQNMGHEPESETDPSGVTVVTVAP